MTVDSFMRHLHDNTGLMEINIPRCIDVGDQELTDKELKLWDTFQRKKELFDNNQLPSPGINQERLIYNIDGASSPVLPSLQEPIVSTEEVIKKPAGPRIIKTPISPMRKEKVVRKTAPKIVNKLKSPAPVNNFETPDNVRSSGRKRKLKQLYPFEEYSFAKFPRLNKNLTDDVEHWISQQLKGDNCTVLNV